MDRSGSSCTRCWQEVMCTAGAMGPTVSQQGSVVRFWTWAVNHSMQNHYNIYNSIVGYSRHVQVTFH